MQAGYLVRLKPNGALDSTFGAGGKVALGLSAGDVKVLGSGKVLVLANEFPSELRRYTGDGALDERFALGIEVISSFRLSLAAWDLS